MFGGKIGFGELLLILAIVLIVFGGGSKIKEIFKSMGEGIKEFKKGMKDEGEEKKENKG
jgi:sec-independent protein translocase protein TatA